MERRPMRDQFNRQGYTQTKEELVIKGQLIMNSIVVPVILVLALLACIFWLNNKIEKEKKRNRTLQAFLAGVIRVISDYRSKTDHDEQELPGRATSLPIPYDTVLEKNIRRMINVEET
jgi:hypothetical protein